MITCNFVIVGEVKPLRTRRVRFFADWRPRKASYPHSWSKVQFILRRITNGRCEQCGRCAHPLTIHHVGAPYADGRPGNAHDKHDLRRENLQVLCLDCHRAIEREFTAREVAEARAHRGLGVGTGLVPVGASVPCSVY